MLNETLNYIFGGVDHGHVLNRDVNCPVKFASNDSFMKISITNLIELQFNLILRSTIAYVILYPINNLALHRFSSLLLQAQCSQGIKIWAI